MIQDNPGFYDALLKGDAYEFLRNITDIKIENEIIDINEMTKNQMLYFKEKFLVFDILLNAPMTPWGDDRWFDRVIARFSLVDDVPNRLDAFKFIKLSSLWYAQDTCACVPNVVPSNDTIEFFSTVVADELNNLIMPNIATKFIFFRLCLFNRIQFFEPEPEP